MPLQHNGHNYCNYNYSCSHHHHRSDHHNHRHHYHRHHYHHHCYHCYDQHRHHTATTATATATTASSHAPRRFRVGDVSAAQWLDLSRRAIVAVRGALAEVPAEFSAPLRHIAEVASEAEALLMPYCVELQKPRRVFQGLSAWWQSRSRTVLWRARAPR